MSKGTSPTPQKKKAGRPKGSQNKKRGPKSVGTIVLPKAISVDPDNKLFDTRDYAAKYVKSRSFKKASKNLVDVAGQIATRMEKIKEFNEKLKENKIAYAKLPINHPKKSELFSDIAAVEKDYLQELEKAENDFRPNIKLEYNPDPCKLGPVTDAQMNRIYPGEEIAKDFAKEMKTPFSGAEMLYGIYGTPERAEKSIIENQAANLVSIDTLIRKIVKEEVRKILGAI